LWQLALPAAVVKIETSSGFIGDCLGLERERGVTASCRARRPEGARTSSDGANVVATQQQGDICVSNVSIVCGRMRLDWRIDRTKAALKRLTILASFC
jgi:hypothetical protein